MRFDPDIMRQLLIAIEELSPGQVVNGSISVDEHPQAVVNEHMQILLDEGYLDGKSLRDISGAPHQFFIRGLKMKGHDFLANARSKGVWDSVIEEAQKLGISLGINVLSGLLLAAAKRKAVLP